MAKVLSNFDKLTLIIYVRNQAKFIRSNYQVAFRPQYEISFDEYDNCFDFASYKRLSDPHTLNYYKLIKKVEDSFPDANITVKAYDLVVKHHDLFRVFCSDLGIKSLEPHVISQRTNESLSFPSHLVMQLSKGILSKKEAFKLFLFLRSHPITSQFLKYDFPNPHQSQRIMGYYQESNQRLFEKYNLGPNEKFELWQNKIDRDNQLTPELTSQIYKDIIRYFLKSMKIID